MTTQSATATATTPGKVPIDDMFWGDRYGIVEDPFGHHWSVATHVRDVSPEELQEAALKMSASGCQGSVPPAQ